MYLSKCDEYLIQKIQAAYLWFYDWTGVYVATVGIMIYFMCLFIDRPPTTWLMCISIGCNIMSVLPHYLQQDRGQFAAFNARALLVQSYLSLRIGFIFFFIGIGVVSLFQGEWQLVVSSVLYVIFIYTYVICIREREPKEWFKRETLATEGSS